MQDNLFELYADICKTLSSPLRLKIINELQEGEKTVNVLTKSLGGQTSKFFSTFGCP
jgi:DNA-binding transcriptional ArsR family regulator